LLGIGLALLLRRPSWRGSKDHDGRVSPPPVLTAGPVYRALCHHLYGGPPPFDSVPWQALPAPDHT
ncbi:unnamed protein product, partial [Symbiodinium natans]